VSAELVLGGRALRHSIGAVPRPVLTSQADDFPRWYQEVIAKAELADNGPVRGTMVIRPWAYAIWERIQSELDARIKAIGVENAYFPLLIPESYLRKEAEHVEGFAPELAVVTHGGGKRLEEPAVVRPTSETIINASFTKWIHSYRDLPLLVNNWSNIVRWELRPRLFLRTTEFLWQEGHTAHASEAEAHTFAMRVLRAVYESLLVELLALPPLVGLKTRAETFAGAVRTWTLEGVMRDGKALQLGTSHELGQGFAKAFGTEFSDADGVRRHPWQTSWAVTTRLIGALIMVHGDDRGLRLPPAVAPAQVVVLVVKDEGGAGDAARRLVDELRTCDVRVRLDDRVEESFGRRAINWELKGAPLRVELGPRDVADGQATLVSRARGSKEPIPLDGAAPRIAAALAGEQAALLADARRLIHDRLVAVDSLTDAIEQGRTGLAELPWSAVGIRGERELADHGITVRCLRLPDGTTTTDREADGLVAIVGRAY
jgi:prolyl-tRNA synthetase